MWITSMGNHGVVGVSQNAGILVALVTSDIGLSPGWRQALILTSAGILLTGPVGNKKMHLKMSSRNWHPFCLSLNVLTSMKVHQHSSSAMAAVQIIQLNMSVYFEYHHINNNAYNFRNIFYSHHNMTSSNTQWGTVIKWSIFTQIFTKDITC